MRLETNGYFWVKEYMPNVPANQQNLIAEGKPIKIRLSWAADQVPAEIAAHPGELKTYQDKEGNPRVSARLKVGKFCQWYDQYGKAVAKPLNTELDGKSYMLKIEFVYKPENPQNSSAPRGFWVNAVMFKLNNAVSFEPFDEAEAETQQQPVQAQVAPQAVAQATQAAQAYAQPQQPAQFAAPAPQANDLPFRDESPLGF